jgi:hypothetical protein
VKLCTVYAERLAARTIARETMRPTLWFLLTSVLCSAPPLYLCVPKHVGFVGKHVLRTFYKKCARVGLLSTILQRH